MVFSVSGTPVPSRGDRFECRKIEFGKVLVELVDRQNVLDVSLVILQHCWDFAQVTANFLEVILEVFPGFLVRVEKVSLGIGNEYDPVYALQDEACGFRC